jgi:propionyl-CoA carboxylase alpha chain
MITSVLVANRGEIARRIFRTCRDLGLATVAVYSDADRDSPHVREADGAVRLPGLRPADTYLRADLLLNAALLAGADAVHPGYGFLSENGSFAHAVTEAGLTWVGPPPSAIDVMGSKVESKRLMLAAGVPSLPELEPADVTEADLPVLIKASAGGGGRGMRVVRRLADLPHQTELLRAEAQAAFGNGTVFCEPYLPHARHIEVQVMADQHGRVWAVGERECSIQRRHQKVIEEAPSPLVDSVAGMRERLFEAARRAAEAVDYSGAGTVEFIADPAGRFFFIEMNTRLQVEHPVTECTTGLDLVALQMYVADGGRLSPQPPKVRGHSIEARLYAEDPGAAWQPQSGVLHRIEVPNVRVSFRPATSPSGLRLDSGVESGDAVSTYYDAMLAKVISWAPTRNLAASILSRALQRSRIHGLVTNRDLLVNTLRHPAFLEGETDTSFFDRHGLADLAAPQADSCATRISALAAALAIDAEAREAAPVLHRIPSGWRNVPSQPQHISFEGVDVAYRFTRDGLWVDGSGDVIKVFSVRHDQVVLEAAGVRRVFEVARYGNEVDVDSPIGPVRLLRRPRFAEPGDQVSEGSLLAPMPGTVVRLAVEIGQPVEAGDPVLWLESMKMQHEIRSPAMGIVTELPVREGQQVEIGTVLALVSAEDYQRSQE